MAQTLLKLSEELEQAVADSGPVVVRVEARRRLPASGIVWSPDGVIVTAHHVVEWSVLCWLWDVRARVSWQPLA